jgi:hypothetical protein
LTKDTEICNSRALYTNLKIGCGNKGMGVVRAKFLGVEISDTLAWRKRINIPLGVEISDALAWRKRINIPLDLLRHVVMRGLVFTHNRLVQ